MAHPSRPVIGLTYSSTDFERFSLWRNMLHGFGEAGATPLTIDCHQSHYDIAGVVRRLDGLVISGGADVDPTVYGGDPGDPTICDIDPVRDQNEQTALRAALDAGLPVLAICRGLQLVNVTLGGTLYADLQRDLTGGVEHEQSEQALAWPLHTVDVVPGSRLSQWLGGLSGRLAVNSEHHQGVRQLGDGLVATAVADDGLIEGAELTDHPLVAVQWHPEILWPNDELALQLLSSFVDVCRTVPAAVQPMPAIGEATTAVIH
jgi:putative glutamine amidotransferase